MRRSYLIFLILCIAVVPSAFGQDATEGSEDFVEAEVPEQVMKGVVQRIVAANFKASKTPRKVLFADLLIRAEWLPKIENVEFVVLTREEIATQGEKVYFFSSVEVQEGKFRVKYGYGEPGCSASGEFWYFWISSNKLRLWKSENEGWGSGCGHGSGH